MDALKRIFAVGLVAAATVLLLARCAVETKQAVPDAGKEEPDAGKEEPDAGDLCGPGNCPTTDNDLLTGFFAVEAIVEAKLIIAIEAKQYILLEFEQNGTNLKEKTTICEFNLPSVEGVATIELTPAVQELLRSKAAEQEGAFLDCAGAGALYDPPAYTVTLGFDTESCDVATDPLPTKQDSTCMKDEDNDGKPGVTLLVEAVSCPAGEKVELYVAIRSVVDFCGRVEDENTMSGLLQPQLEQSILGYSDDCLAMAEGLAIEIEGGSYTARRVDSKGEINLDVNSDNKVECSEFTSRINDVFPEEEEQ